MDKGNESVVSSVRMPKELYEKLKAKAEEESRTVNNLLLVIVKDYLEKD